MLNFYFGFERLNQEGNKLFRYKDYRKKANVPPFLKLKMNIFLKRILFIITLVKKRNVPNF